MAPEFAVTAFGLRDAKGRRMRETTLNEVAAGAISAVFIGAGDPGARPYRFRIRGPRGVHTGPRQRLQIHSAGEPPTVMLEHEISPTAVAERGKYRLSLCRLESADENEEGDRELHSVVFFVK